MRYDVISISGRHLEAVDGDVEVEDLFAAAAAISVAFEVVTSQHGQTAVSWGRE